MSAMPPVPVPASVGAWDLPTRLFHWLLVLLVLAAWFSVTFASEIGDRRILWHRWNGLAILVLLLWRLLWGVFGSSTAHFASFVRGPAAAARYVRDLAAGGQRRYLGHNPAGALMVVALLAVVLAQAGLGLFSIDDNDLFGGPLARLVDEDASHWATGWHARLFNYVILPLASLHILANAFYGMVKGEPLIRAMVTGRKPRLAYEDAAELIQPKGVTLRALLCLAAAAIIVFGTIYALTGRLV